MTGETNQATRTRVLKDRCGSFLPLAHCKWQESAAAATEHSLLVAEISQRSRVCTRSVDPKPPAAVQNMTGPNL